ncbi:uncharacterized protein LOC134273032 [Saccostrea cucullata]|uniref:uncharacterized protein LOC134273032 n=1 Tax=Saccostrea cuccullata TaxID=36930 RepID=UPI002ED25C02
MNNGTLPSLQRSGCSCEKSANFDFRPKIRGRKFTIYKGKMHSCCNDIQTAAVKFDSTRKGSKESLEIYIKESKTAHDIARKFSKMCNVTIRFPELHLAVMDEVSFLTNTLSDSRKLSSEEFVLFEPFIKGRLEYFVTCEGIVTKKCPQIIQELCHFSFQDSNGTSLLRGVKGQQIRVNGKHRLQLASPSTCVFSEGGCEPDIRVAVKNFFDTHQCTQRCEKWLNCHLYEKSHLTNFVGSPPPYVS